MKDQYRILIGSIGDDSHSVGMKLLEVASEEWGFGVKNIGILNTLDDIFYRAHNFEIIFISCMNGHVDLYLENFPKKFSAFRLGNGKPQAWYLGGNLSLQNDSESVIKKFKNIGFDYVAPKPVSIDVIKRQIHKDIYIKKIKPGRIDRNEKNNEYLGSNLDLVDDQGLTDHEFLAIRDEVLSSWHTGSQVQDTNINKNHSDPAKNFHIYLKKNYQKRNGPLVQPRTGVAHTLDEIDILTFLHKEGLEISSIQLDAASRKCMFDKAEQGVCQTLPGEKSCLNGYPVPVHGVKGVQQIVSNIETPFQIRAGSPDHRFVYEIGLAGGASSLEGGFLCYLFPYDKNSSPVEALKHWKYIDKLAQWYQRNYQVIINREYFGPLTCCLIEPCIPICINIIEALLSAKSGVKCISVGIAEQGNRNQDIAAVNVLREMTRKFLNHFGFSDVMLTTVFHQYMAAFPTDENKASELILNSSITSALAKADRIMTKTPVESLHIPTKEDNARGLKLTHAGIAQANDIRLDIASVNEEACLICREVEMIMMEIIKIGQGSIARGAMMAFQKGILDIPFSPSIYNRGKLVTARDCNGAVRFVNPERLPFEEKDKETHKQKIHKRMFKEGSYNTAHLLEQDLTRIWKNDYLRWPLDGHYAQ